MLDIALQKLIDKLRRQAQFGGLHTARPDHETAALVLSLLAGGTLHRVLPTDDRRAQRARANQLAQGVWADVRMQKALQDVADGVSAAIAVVATGE